jgi:hypothetical protein
MKEVLYGVCRQIGAAFGPATLSLNQLPASRQTTPPQFISHPQHTMRQIPRQSNLVKPGQTSRSRLVKFRVIRVIRGFQRQTQSNPVKPGQGWSNPAIQGGVLPQKNTRNAETSTYDVSSICRDHPFPQRASRTGAESGETAFGQDKLDEQDWEKDVIEPVTTRAAPAAIVSLRQILSCESCSSCPKPLIGCGIMVADCLRCIILPS